MGLGYAVGYGLGPSIERLGGRAESLGLLAAAGLTLAVVGLRLTRAYLARVEPVDKAPSRSSRRAGGPGRTNVPLSRPTQGPHGSVASLSSPIKRLGVLLTVVVVGTPPPLPAGHPSSLVGPTGGSARVPARRLATGRRTGALGCASKAVMVREIGLGVLLTMLGGLAVWALSHPPGGSSPVAGILGKPVVLTPADWEPSSAPRPRPDPAVAS